MAITGDWTLFYDWNCDGDYGSTIMTVKSDGTWENNDGYEGVWVQVAGMFMFSSTDLSVTYSGNLASKSVTGIMSNYHSLSGCFYMLQSGVSTTFATKRIESKMDSSGK